MLLNASKISKLGLTIHKIGHTNTTKKKSKHNLIKGKFLAIAAYQRIF